MSLYNIKTAYKLTYKALEKFLLDENTNIKNGVNERNLVGRLALILNHQINIYGITDYYVDTEYNRKQDGQIKTILIPGDIPQPIRINCDLIIHSRGELGYEDNFIAFEMKKSTRPRREKDKDRDRLIALTKPKNDPNTWSADGDTHPEHVCGYLLGVYVELNQDMDNVLLEFYEKGGKVKEQVLPLKISELKNYLDEKCYLSKK